MFEIFYSQVKIQTWQEFHYNTPDVFMFEEKGTVGVIHGVKFFFKNPLVVLRQKYFFN